MSITAIKKVKKRCVMNRIIVSIFLVLTFLCSPVMSITAEDWIKKADALWDGQKYTNPKKAIEYFNNAIKLKPDNAILYFDRGIAYGQLDRYKRSLEDYNKAIRLKPDLAQAYINRAVFYLNHGNKKQGCLDAQKACKLRNCLLLDMAKTKGFCK